MSNKSSCNCGFLESVLPATFRKDIFRVVLLSLRYATLANWYIVNAFLLASGLDYI